MLFCNRKIIFDHFCYRYSSACIFQNTSFVFINTKSCSKIWLCLRNPIEIVGSINRDIPDGQYRLYISAQKRNQQTSSLVVLKDTDIPEAPTKELYYRVIVKKGIAYIDDKEYEILPTNIDNIQLLQNSKSSYYTLDGRKIYRLESLPKGIYVMQQDGKTKKIYR